LTLQNSFVRVSGSSAYAIYRGSSASYSGNYNGFYLKIPRADGRSQCHALQPHLFHAGRLGYATGNDAASLIGDPALRMGSMVIFICRRLNRKGVDVPALDVWTNDAANSMLLDAGTGSYANETTPKGERANIGVYGDSMWASRSATNSDCG
jgi:hypothetical protein